ncbi:MAG: hypothetical protein ABIK28_05355, partial [Planctomycetota bacterium]
MNRAQRDALRLLFGVTLSVIAAWTLNAQDPTEKVESDREIKTEATEPDLVLEFPGEKLEPALEKMDGKGIIAAGKAALGNLDFLKDLTVEVEHKHYREEGLHFIEEFECFFDVNDNRLPKLRLDFLNYVESDTRVDSLLDYREIFGEDGAFKFREGVVIRVPDALREAGARTLKTYLMILGPFCSLLDTEKAEYVGKCSWSELIDEEEVTYNCHKVVVLFNDERIKIVDQKVALYFDSETYDLVRAVYRPGSEKNRVNRVKITDYIAKTQVESAMLPTHILVFDYWNDEITATHKYTLDG